MNVAVPAARNAPDIEETLATRQGRIQQLDGLRGLAVLSVLLYHYTGALPSSYGGVLSGIRDPFRLGWCGVDLFFVLSGFLIGGILLDARTSPAYFKTFYLRRFHRIFPLYYLWIAAYFVLAFTLFPRLPAPLTVSSPDWKGIPIYALFAQNLLKKQLTGLSDGWMGPLWSLAVEEQFYLVMPLLVRFLSRRRLVQTLLAAIVCAPILRLLVYWRFPGHTAQYVVTPCRADALAIGVLLAIALRDDRWRGRLFAHNNRLLLPLGALSVGVIYFAAWRPSPFTLQMSIWGFSCIDFFFALCLLLALAAPQGWWATFCRWRAWRELGAISYCIYVIHLAVYDVSRAVVIPGPARPPLANAVAAILLAAAATWLLAKISRRYLESPMIRRGHSYRY